MLLEIISHLANGVKRFKTTYRRQKSVDDAENQSWIDDGWIEPGYFETPKVVNLTERSKEYFQTNTVEVFTLVEHLCRYSVQENVSGYQLISLKKRQISSISLNGRC